MNKLNTFGVASVYLVALVAGLVSCQPAAPAATATPPPPTITPTPAPTATPVTIIVETQVPVTVIVPTYVVVPFGVEVDALFAAQPADRLAGRQEPALRTETFADANVWESFETETLRTWQADQAYHISIQEPNRLNWGLSSIQAQDFYLETTVQAPNCQAGDHFGVLFRASDASNFYLFGISCSGEFRLLRYRDNNFELLTNWQANLAIQPKGAPNVLALRVVGDRIHTYANQQYLGSIIDNTFDNGAIGLYAGTRFGERLQADFSNLTVWALSTTVP